MDRGDLSVELMGRGLPGWIQDSRKSLGSAQYIETVQRMQNVQVANLEEIAYRMAISLKSKCMNWRSIEKNEYGHYLLRLIGEE